MANDPLEETLSRIAIGDRSAFDSLYSDFSERLFGICHIILNDTAAAEEALKDAFARIWESADSFRSQDLEPTTWLVTTARDVAVDRLRARRGVGADEDWDIARFGADVSLLEGLEPGSADALVGAYLLGESYTDLARRAASTSDAMRQELRETLLKLLDPLSAATGRQEDLLLAAEYTLDLLSHDEKGAFEARMLLDPSLNTFYAQWCERLAPLADVPPIAPEGHVKAALDKRLFEELSIPKQLLRWAFGALGGAAVAAAVAYVSLLYVIPMLTQTVLEAQLVGTGDATASARFESHSGILSVSTDLPSPGDGSVHEVWLVFPSAEPVYLGLLDPTGAFSEDLPADLIQRLPGAGIAISRGPMRSLPSGGPGEDIVLAGPFTAL